MNRAVIGWTVALTLTGLAGAQTQNQQQPGQQQPTQPGQQSGSDLRNNQAVTRAMQTLGQSNLFEILSSEAAIQRGVQGQAREFAQMMITEHRQNQQQLETLARRLGVTLPTSVGAANDARIRNLERQTGAALTRTYLQAQVNGHRATLTVLESAVRSLGGQTQQGQSGGQSGQGQSTQPQGSQGQGGMTQPGQGQGGTNNQNQGQSGQNQQGQQGQGGTSSNSPTTGGTSTNPAQPQTGQTGQGGQGGTADQNQGQGQSTQPQGGQGQGGQSQQGQQNQQSQGNQGQNQQAPSTEEVRQFLEQTTNAVRRHLQEAQKLLQSNQ